MSILLAKEIREEFKKDNIKIEPFIEENLAVNSIDVTLSEKIATYVPLEFSFNQKYGCWNAIPIKNIIIDIRDPKIKSYQYKIPKEGLILLPGILYLGSTNEKVGSSKYVPMYEGRSSMARLGIQSHISAGFGDLGFESYWTLEIIVVHPLCIIPNTRIGQVYFHRVEKEISKEELYKGKYLNQSGPTVSKAYEDFES